MLHPFDISAHLHIREGEVKLGECIARNWRESQVKFVLLGICEDVGVQLNRGIGGTRTAWYSFLKAFLHIQSTERLTGDDIGIYGHLDFTELEISQETMRHIDREVSEIVVEIAASGKIPIVIGGGHNNAYPILKGVSEAKKQAIHALNLDAHSDFRQKEGRHSGNGFRYAFEAGFLQKYAVLGLHENYNAQNIINEMRKNPNLWFCFWEDIFLRETCTFSEVLQQAIGFVQNAPCGIELDLDCIENTLSSAQSPCGISTTHARQFVHRAAQQLDVAYLHICEGAIELDSSSGNGETRSTTGKLISYLVSDFMKAVCVVS